MRILEDHLPAENATPSGKKSLPPALLKRLQARGIAAAAADGAATAVEPAAAATAQLAEQTAAASVAPAGTPQAPLASGPQGKVKSPPHSSHKSVTALSTNLSSARPCHLIAQLVLTHN